MSSSSWNLPERVATESASRPRSRHRGRIASWILASFVATLAAGSAAAQYSVLGGRATSEMPSQESFEEAIAKARWSAGPLRFEPWIGLRDASYVQNQDDVDGDREGDQEHRQLTVTAGAGLRAYAPVGMKAIFAAHALPEYVWWQEDDAKTGVNGRYGAGLFAYGNRLELQLFHRIEKQQQLFSDEVQELTSLTTATSVASAEVRIASGLYAFLGAEHEELEGEEDDSPRFASLDRSVDGWNAGVRLRSHRGWSVGLGVAESEVDFEPGTRALSYDASSYLLEAKAESDKLRFSLDVRRVDATPKADSELEGFEETLGRARLAWQPRERFGVQIFGERRTSFSVFETRSLVIGDEQGVEFLLGLGAADLRLLASTGSNDYEGVGALPDQSEDVSTFGAFLGLRVGSWATLGVNAIQRNFEGIPGRDREVTSFGFAIQLGAGLRRLSIGEAESAW